MREVYYMSGEMSSGKGGAMRRPQLVKKVRSDFFDKLKGRPMGGPCAVWGAGQEMVMRPAGSPYFSVLTVPPSTSVMYCMTTSSMAMPRS